MSIAVATIGMSYGVDAGHATNPPYVLMTRWMGPHSLDRLGIGGFR